MKRIISLTLAFALLLAALPLPGFAAEQKLIPVQTELPDSDALFAGYVEQVFYGGSTTFGTAAGRQLTGDSKRIYDALVPVLQQIASGRRSNTRITMGQTASTGSTTYTPEIAVTFTGKAPTNAQMMAVIYALLSDLPYDLYWFDKTTGFYFSPVVSSTGTLKYLEIGFVVADNYKVTDYKTNTTRTSAAATAAANAQKIVSRYAEGSDFGKLLGYCEEICDLVEYDYKAASLGNFHEKIDPWQLIHVFDGDPDTNVVCEGYAKAFMYLCDRSSFSGETAAYTVGGWMDGGAHMWNVVTLEGRNYLVDVTNFDIGCDLFLAGASGSVTGGYRADDLRYVYDDLTLDLWGTGSDSILKLSASGYDLHSFGRWTQTLSPTTEAEGRESRSCTLCGHTETRTIPMLDLLPPVISVSVNTATGKPRIKWSAVDGAKYYRIYRSTAKSGSYTYLKSTSSTTFTDTTAKAGQNYYYKVKSLTEDCQRLSPFSNIVNRACDLPMPVVTMKVNTATGKPKPTWEAVSGAAKYRIYRSEKKSSGYSLLKNTTATSYIDTTAVVGENYYYKVKAIHSNSAADSAFSEVINRVCDLPKPDVTITRLNGDPRLKWDAIPDAEKYYIYRSTSEDGEYSHIKTTVTATSYTDTTAKAGTTYYYKVKALHQVSAANSAYSIVRSITAK